jgi:hypothetical protein
MLAKQDTERLAYLDKYIFTPGFFKRVKNNYFDFLGDKKYIPTKEFTEYMNSPENMAKFLREKGVAPLYDMPSFGKHVVVGNGGHRGTWTEAPKTRNKPLDSSAAQGYIIGRPSETLLDIDTVYPGGREGLKEIFDSNYKSRFRDDGVRYQGEDPRYAVTRKTYPFGGILERYGKDNIRLALNKVKAGRK